MAEPCAGLLSSGSERRCRARLAAAAAGRRGAAAAAAAVLVPLCSVRGRPALLFTLRSRRLGGPHSGDVRYRRTGKRGTGTHPTAAFLTQGQMVAPVVANLGVLEDLTLTPNPDEVGDPAPVASPARGEHPHSPAPAPPPCSPPVPSGGRDLHPAAGSPPAGGEPRLHALPRRRPLQLHPARLPQRPPQGLGAHGHHHRADPGAAGTRPLPSEDPRVGPQPLGPAPRGELGLTPEGIGSPPGCQGGDFGGGGWGRKRSEGVACTGGALPVPRLCGFFHPHTGMGGRWLPWGNGNTPPHPNTPSVLPPTALPAADITHCDVVKSHVWNSLRHGL
ncbi:nucleoside diphosphate-linked moiety X motif 8 isoform X2 [Aquila chrysaetos chrysaetos]|uniref:nucleoside diphosphate-linked moiety X motif 8 isoform X2 n=1 Tax=Aquila chrysaetos chrysaetos TaxID=223781 RepID=UPI001B7D2B88|nr:nucleoside diphosphate-linked moiety X motif 8 isoform X2 [Aquila chrysaetos chrysaetos]